MKQSLFLALILILISYHTSTVGLSIQKGSGIWNVETRIASQLDAISLCAGISITQADIASGTYLIANNNTTYCLDQNISPTFGPAIKITASNITLDLKGNSIDGQNFPTNGIELAGGIKNVTIKNGIIRNMKGTSPNGIGIYDSAGHAETLDNIIIENITFYNNSTAAIRLNFASSSIPDTHGLLIENCTTFNSGNIECVSSSGIIQNCTVEESRDGGIEGGIKLVGQSSFVAENFTIQDCITTSSFGTNVNAITMQRCENIVLRNCMIQGSNSSGVFITFCKDVAISDCIVQRSNASIGIGILVGQPLNNGTVTMERCVANQYTRGIQLFIDNLSGTFSSASIIDCSANFNQQWGFFLPHINFSLEWKNIIIKRCSAAYNGAGFLIDTEIGANNFSQIIFEDCVAQNNMGNGFTLQCLGATGNMTDIIFRNCIAQRNTSGIINDIAYYGDGFSIGTTSDHMGLIKNVIFENCIAQGNSNDGFSFDATSSHIKTIDCLSVNNTSTGFNLRGIDNLALGCISVGNNTDDFFGISDPTLIASYNSSGAINGAGRFVNLNT